MFNKIFPRVATGVLCLALGAAEAAEAPAAAGVVSLTSSASVEVTKDELTVTLGTNREGTDAATVQSQLKQAVDAALAEARRVAKPGALAVHTGGFSISPRYNNKGETNGWQGSAELVVDGRDMAAIGQLTGRISTLTIRGVAFNISRELRDKTESEVSAQAIAHYRAKAAEYAKQFGYAGYAIREVSVATNETPVMRPIPTMQVRSVKLMSSEEALPIEAGKGLVAVSVTGTVQLTR